MSYHLHLYLLTRLDMPYTLHSTMLVSVCYHVLYTPSNLTSYIFQGVQICHSVTCSSPCCCKCILYTLVLDLTIAASGVGEEVGVVEVFQELLFRRWTWRHINIGYFPYLVFILALEVWLVHTRQVPARLVRMSPSPMAGWDGFFGGLQISMWVTFSLTSVYSRANNLFISVSLRECGPMRSVISSRPNF